jgi:hypothetical protein
MKPSHDPEQAQKHSVERSCTSDEDTADLVASDEILTGQQLARDA